MGYRIKDGEAISGEIRRIVEEQIDRAVAEIDATDLDAGTKVHQVRKRCKKIRAVLRLARGPLEKDAIYGTENAFFRDVAAGLSGLRDADVLIQTHDSVVKEIESPDLLIECAGVRGRLTGRRHEQTEAMAGVDEQLREARSRLLEGRERVSRWAERVRGFQGLKPGLKRTYRLGRQAMKAAYQSRSDEDFHAWRKRVKYHWYACRLLRRLWPMSMEARHKETGRLGRLLGDDHDLAVYRALLQAEAGWFGQGTRALDLLAVVDRRRRRLRTQARPLGMRLYAETPRELSARFAHYRRAWRAGID